MCPLGVSGGTEVDMSPSSSMGVGSMLGLTGFRGGSSESLEEVLSCGGDVNSSAFGGGNESSAS